MGIATIRQIIDAAVTSDVQTGALRSYFGDRLEDLEARLALPAQDALGALVRFARKYIEYVPEFLEQISTRARERGMEREVAPLLHLAEDFFLAPPDDLDGDSGLHALLDEAFLAQRLIEEINDRLVRSHGELLVSMDMTRANIIAHHLVGEPLATRLEMLVRRSVDLVAPRSGLESIGKSAANPVAAEQLPCMSREVAVGLRLEGR